MDSDRSPDAEHLPPTFQTVTTALQDRYACSYTPARNQHVRYLDGNQFAADSSATLGERITKSLVEASAIRISVTFFFGVGAVSPGAHGNEMHVLSSILAAQLIP